MKYLISAYSGLGNTIQLSSLINLIKDSDIKAEITFISDNKFSQIDFLNMLEGINVKKIEKVNLFTQIFYLKRYIEEDIDKVILPYVGTPIIVQLASYLSGKIIIQHNPINWNKSKVILYLFKKFNNKIKALKINKESIEEERYIDLIQDFIKSRKSRTNLNINLSSHKSILKKFKLPHKFLCLQVGGANGGLTPKVWPKENIEKFVELLNKHKPECIVVLLGDKSDREKYKIKNPNAINLVGKTSIIELVNILNASSAVICNDSSILHLANLFQLKTFVLLGPSIKEFPLSSSINTLSADLPCMPCLDGLKVGEEEALNNCPIDNLCMKLVSPEQVLNKLID
tara:strand:+ start:1147 stop:2175 length:1029 start_codon:yes stop_codon:yes gene_type:complete